MKKGVVVHQGKTRGEIPSREEPKNAHNSAKKKDGRIEIPIRVKKTMDSSAWGALQKENQSTF